MTDYRDSSFSRSPSSDRSQSKTYTQDSDSYYSDDFDKDSRRSTPRNKARTKRTRRRSPYTSDHTITSAQTAVSKNSTQSLGRRQARNKRKNTHTYGARSQSYSKDHGPKKTPRTILRDSVASRMLSAKRHKVNELTNELAETKQKLHEAMKENRLLRTLQHRQDKAIRKFEDTESDLPRLIAQHSNDERVMRARLRKVKDSERALDHQIREKDEDIAKMERTLRKLKKLVYEKNLGERSELSRQLGDIENRLTAMERKKQELEKKLELTMSSYNRQLHGEQIKHKTTKMQLQTLHDEYTRLEHKLKEKERALEISNIYSLRQKISPEKALALTRSNLDSARSSGYLHSSGTQTDLALFPLPVENGTMSIASTPHKQTLAKHRPINTPHGNINQQNTMTTDVKEESEIASQFNGLSLNNGPTPNHQSTPKESNIKSDSKRSVFLTANFESPATSRDNSFASASSKSPDQKKIGSDSGQIDPEQAELNAMLAEANKQEEYERQRRLEEEQRQKRELLARMREVESKDSPSDLNLHPVHKPPTQSQKPNIVEQLFKSDISASNNNHNNKQIDVPHLPSKTSSHSQESLKESPLRNRKSYQFTKEVENLHRGLPASREGSAASKPDREISFGSYAPTVGVTPARRKTQTTKPAVVSSESDTDEPMFDLNSGKQKKKSDLLTQLFGEQAKTQSANNQPEISNNAISNPKSQTPRAKPIHSNYPWERKMHTQGNGDGNLSMTSAPVVKAVPSFNDEDIEEVAL